MVTTTSGEPIEQDMPASIVDSYNTVNSSQMPSMVMSYPSGVIQNETLPSEDVPPSQRFSNTLVGRIAKMLRPISCLCLWLGEEKHPMLIDEIVTRITPVFSELRKMDGTRYKGNILKAVNGALSSTGIFLRLDVRMRVRCELQNLKWMIREEELEIYEERAQKKLKAKGKRKRERESSGVIAVECVGASGAEEEKPAKRKYAKRRDRKQAIITMLSSISDMQHSQNIERNMIYSQNPFEVGLMLRD